MSGSRYTVVPITPIPIDDNLCPANNGTNAPPTGTTPTLPTPPPESRTPNDMCEAVQLVATEVPSRVSLPPLTLEEGCSAFENCNGVSCIATYGNDQYNATLTILQCKKPAAVNIVLNDANGIVHINRTMDKNTTIPFSVYGFKINVFVTVFHPTRDSILLAVSIYVCCTNTRTCACAHTHTHTHTHTNTNTYTFIHILFYAASYLTDSCKSVSHRYHSYHSSCNSHTSGPICV